MVVTEVGWATHSNARGIQPHNPSEEFQAIWYQNLMDWSEQTGMMVFMFKTLDEALAEARPIPYTRKAMGLVRQWLTAPARDAVSPCQSVASGSRCLSLDPSKWHSCPPTAPPMSRCGITTAHCASSGPTQDHFVNERMGWLIWSRA